MKESWKHVSRAAVVAIALGLGSGVIGTALTANYLSTYAISLGDLSSPPRLSQERPRSAPQTYAEALSQVTDSVLPGVARVYRAGSYATPLASGAVLTSDGWIATTLEYRTAVESDVVVVGGKGYVVTRVALEPGTNLQFLKVDASNLPVFAFGSGFDVRPGDQLFAVPSPTAVFSETAVESLWPAGAISSDVPSRRISVEDPLLGNYPGAPVVNVRGELIGFVEGSAMGFTSVLPVDGVLPPFNALLRTGMVARASLGVSSTDLTRTLGLPETETSGRAQGALLRGTSSVKKGSAGAVAGLLAGDVILSVNGTPIDETRALDDLIVTHVPGDEIVLRVARGSEEIELRAILGAL